MKNLVITTALTIGLLIPGISFAGNIFGVDKELITNRDRVESNIVTPTHTAEGLNDTLVPQKLEENQLQYSDKKYEDSSNVFGVDIDSENIG